MLETSIVKKNPVTDPTAASSPAPRAVGAEDDVPSSSSQSSDSASPGGKYKARSRQKPSAIISKPYSRDLPIVEIPSLQHEKLQKHTGEPGEVGKNDRYNHEWIQHELKLRREKWQNKYFQFLSLVAGKTGLSIEDNTNSVFNDLSIVNPDVMKSVIERLPDVDVDTTIPAAPINTPFFASLDAEQRTNLTSFLMQALRDGKINADTKVILKMLFPASEANRVDWSSAIEHTGTAFVNPSIVAGIESAHNDIQHANGRDIDLDDLMTGHHIRADFAQLVALNISNSMATAHRRMATVTQNQTTLILYQKQLYRMSNLRLRGGELHMQKPKINERKPAQPSFNQIYQYISQRTQL